MTVTRIPRTRARNNESGFFTIYVLALVMMVAFVGGISYDLWHGFSDRRQVSSMVDAAAVAGATQIDVAAFQADSSVVRLDKAAAETSARDYLVQAQTETGTDLTDIQVTVTDTTISVRASTTTKLTLTKLLYHGDDLVSSVTGTASPQPGA